MSLLLAVAADVESVSVAQLQIGRDRVTTRCVCARSRARVRSFCVCTHRCERRRRWQRDWCGGRVPESELESVCEDEYESEGACTPRTGAGDGPAVGRGGACVDGGLCSGCADFGDGGGGAGYERATSQLKAAEPEGRLTHEPGGRAGCDPPPSPAPSLLLVLTSASPTAAMSARVSTGVCAVRWRGGGNFSRNSENRAVCAQSGSNRLRKRAKSKAARLTSRRAVRRK
eukprot:2775332-Pleurochrysis_carterae.AAC.2